MVNIDTGPARNRSRTIDSPGRLPDTEDAAPQVLAVCQHPDRVAAQAAEMRTHHGKDSPGGNGRRSGCAAFAQNFQPGVCGKRMGRADDSLVGPGLDAHVVPFYQGLASAAGAL